MIKKIPKHINKTSIIQYIYKQNQTEKNENKK